jgi:colanic acid/amylovoran biosynthesis protein
MKKIVIVGTSVYGVENFGDEALLRVFTKSLKTHMPECEIVLFARHPGKKLDDFFDVKSFKNIEHDSKEESMGRWFYGMNPGDSTDHMNKMIKEIESCDLLVIGGDPFAEIVLGVYRGLISYAALMITLSKFLQKPVMLYGIHMGRPIQSDYGKELSKFVVVNTDLMTLRERFSIEVLEKMGIMPREAVCLSDPAFGLDPFPDTRKGMEIINKEGIEFLSDKIIGINFRYHYWEWKKADWGPRRDMMAKLCDFMVEEFGADLLFIPNCTYDIDHKYEDDRPGAAEIVESMKHRKHAHQIRQKHNLFETLSLFPLLDMHYSSRRHSLCFAALHGVPIIGSEAAGKWHIKPIMEELKVEENFLDLEQLSLTNLQEKLVHTWNNRKTYSERILSAIPELREKALAHGKAAADFINRQENK